MIIKVKAGEITIDVSVGDGRQTFRWLAGVIQQRITQYHMRRKRFETESYLVTELKNTNGELLNPADLIYEHGHADGFTICATLVSSYPVDEWDNPDMGDWMRSAYVKSDIGSHYAEELDAWRNNLRAIDRHEEGVMIGSGSTSTFIKVGFDFSDDDIDSAFDLDWGNMKWGWLGAVSDSQKNAIGDVMKSNYRLFCNVFAHYCGIGQVGQRYGLSIEEFAHLLHFMRLYNYKETPAAIENIFHKTGSNAFAASVAASEAEAELAAAARAAAAGCGDNEEDSTMDADSKISESKAESKVAESKLDAKLDAKSSLSAANSITDTAVGAGASVAGGRIGAVAGRWPLMTRAHLAQALLCAAVSSKLGESPSQALANFISGPLQTFWTDITSNYLFYTTKDPMLKSATLEYYQLLKQAFLLRGSNPPVPSGPKLSISKFVDLLVDTGMIDEDMEPICVNSFLLTQFNPSVHWELQYLVLAEFIEALSRVALKTIENSTSLTDAKKIRMAFNFMTELQNEAYSASSGRK